MAMRTTPPNGMNRTTASHFRSTAMAGLALTLVACAINQPTECTVGERPAIQDTLYFGLAKPEGQVSPNEWAAFLNAAVTPRFPQGFSVWQADGQWRFADGTVIREPTRVLNLIHPDDHRSKQAILAIMAQYKSQFRQEAVLRVRTWACITY